MRKIVASVGRKGKNFRSDTILIQELLNRAIRPPFRLLKVDGIAQFHTISAIDQFQKDVLKFKNPDGLVDPGGKTWHALARYRNASANSFTHYFLSFLGLDKDNQNTKPPQTQHSNNAIAWGAKVTPAFKNKVIKICTNLGIPPDYLMSCMAFETGETFKPDIKNAAGSGAVGLIQFMPRTAKGLGTSTDSLSKMTAVKQLDYVEKYFHPKKSKLKTLEDVYMAILYPAAIGKPSSHTLFSKNTATYDQNKGFDKNKDGKITLAEISGKVRSKYEKGLKQGYLG
jgi:hypothetical protein